jgi:hypothetical protein
MRQQCRYGGSGVLRSGASAGQWSSALRLRAGAWHAGAETASFSRHLLVFYDELLDNLWRQASPGRLRLGGWNGLSGATLAAELAVP